MKEKIVLIAGGSGMVGMSISKKLAAQGYLVRHLGRSAKPRATFPCYAWDPSKGSIDESALEGVSVIINLAGAPIAERWTPSYRSEILRSRVDGTLLLWKTVHEQKIPLEKYISASAVGYYPNSLDQEFSEDAKPGSDFLSQVCVEWETAAKRFEQLDIPTYIMRIGIVLSTEGGALPKMAQPVKFGAGAALGSGKQWMPWIHIDDLAEMFAFALHRSNLEPGVYNAVGPKSATNKELTQAIAKVLKRPLFLPAIPTFVLKLMLGDMAETVLASNKASAKKIIAAGFSHRHPQLVPALEDLYQR